MIIMMIMMIIIMIMMIIIMIIIIMIIIIMIIMIMIIIIMIIIIIKMSVLPKGRSFTASAGIKTTVLPEAGLHRKLSNQGCSFTRDEYVR